MAFEYFTGHTMKEIIQNLFKKIFYNRTIKIYNSISKFMFGEQFVKKKSTKKNMKESKCPKCQCKCQCDYNNENENENNKPNSMNETPSANSATTENNGIPRKNASINEELMQNFLSFPSLW